MCPDTAMYVHVSSDYYIAQQVVYMCPQTATFVVVLIPYSSSRGIYMSSYYYVSVSSYYYIAHKMFICPHTTIGIYMCMCPHTTS